MPEFNVISGLVRHALTAGGSVLATNGYIEQSQVDVLAGSLLVIIGAVWSYLSKRMAAKKLVANTKV